MVLHVFVLMLLSFLMLFLAQRRHLYWTHHRLPHSKAVALYPVVHRLLKPRSSGDYPVCRLSYPLSSSVEPAPLGTDGRCAACPQCAPIGPTITQAVMKPITIGSSGRLTTLSAAPLHDSKQLTDGNLNYDISIPPKSPPPKSPPKSENAPAS